MNNQQAEYNFTVSIERGSNDHVNFKYFQNGQEVSGGGTVSKKNTIATYTLNKATLNEGFLFSGATITGDCAEDFSVTVSENKQSIVIKDTDNNSGKACLIFNVTLNNKPYQSKDPQVINKEEL